MHLQKESEDITFRGREVPMLKKANDKIDNIMSKIKPKKDMTSIKSRYSTSS
jgi:hypothetical protein